MNFINECIMNKYCTDSCQYYKDNICNEDINFHQCSVRKFLNWLNDNNMDVSNLIMINKNCKSQ